jgi:hypothetical protein
MAYGQFAIPGYNHPYWFGHHILWMQSARWYFCTINGHWRILWTDGGNHGEGNVRNSTAFSRPGKLLSDSLCL